MTYKPIWRGEGRRAELALSTHKKQYFRLTALMPDGTVCCESPVFDCAAFYALKPFREKLNRGLIAVKTNEGIFLSWRLFKSEVTGFSDSGLVGANFKVLRNGKEIAYVTDSCNYIDIGGGMEDEYSVCAVLGDKTFAPCKSVKPWKSGQNYIDLPIQKPEGGISPSGERYDYHPNDLSVGDVNGDGEFEYIFRWEPTNAKDNSQKGYTGNCIIDCYTLEGRLLWRLDMGKNIRAGAHYTQFMVYDFNMDGKAEMALKTAPGTKMTVYNEDGTVKSERYITLPESDVKAGVSHEDAYACSAADYRENLISLFMNWQNHPEVKRRLWPARVEECFNLEERYIYPLSRPDAEKLADYFIYDYAPRRSPKNELWRFEGFIFKGPEYLTMFAGDGSELETIPYPYPRVDDGLMWGDYSWNRVEPMNRNDRYLAGVAYLDGERPYLIMCRGYYTRTTLAAYDFFDNKFRLKWGIDSGFVPMRNPFAPTPAGTMGSDPVYGMIVNQGNHSLSVADVDGDGRDEIVYGACVIDDDGSVLWSGQGFLTDGRFSNWAHGDSMHVAVIDPDTPGMEIMHVFEDGRDAPYGHALVEAADGKVIYGVPSDKDLGRCMIGKIDMNTRGWQVWCEEVRDCKGNVLPLPMPGTNFCVRWSPDLTTQVLGSVDYLKHDGSGQISDLIHGVMLTAEGAVTNNYTKGNPCLAANIFGDYREQVILRLKDDSALRIYTNTELSHHKLFTLIEDTQYRLGVAWQNTCYNQPVYPSFYYGPDMSFEDLI
ncbi:MAG: rhamnogalacturonan lyase [Clostridia bacterium]|nr:rhamnogalacturonan lyase [Clostridia bacterium]